MTVSPDTPEICAARAADPAWQAEQVEKNLAASARMTERWRSLGLPHDPSPNMRVAFED